MGHHDQRILFFTCLDWSIPGFRAPEPEALDIFSRSAFIDGVPDFSDEGPIAGLVIESEGANPRFLGV
jgi:hypothetical protein